MRILAYLFYGNKTEYEWELLFSVYSALRQMRSRPVKICVISDRPCLDLPVDHLPFSSAEFTAWTTSPHGVYNHRIKVHALIKVLDHYQCPVALVDTDTYFTDHPAKLFDRISPEQTVMNFEYPPVGENDLWLPMMEHIRNGIEISGVNISPASRMFNSGVIGVEPSHRGLLEKSLAIIDDLYGRSPIFNIEQFAVGVTLNQFTHLVTCEDLLEHYYGPSRSFIHLQISRAFQTFTAASLEQQLANPKTIHVGYPTKALPDKLIARILGLVRRWQQDYRFAYLAYRSAFFYAPQDAGYANVWATTALQTLQFAGNTRALNGVRRDFRRFGAGAIESLAWLEPQVKQKWLQFWQQLP
jgi:hypothetical protein